MIRFGNGALARLAPLAVVLLASSTTLAQDATVGVGAQTAVPPHPAPPPMAAGTDHDMFVGHWAVGWYGTRDVPIGVMGTAIATQATHVVGVRYWATPMIGIDGGLGFSTTSGSVNDQPQPPGTTFDSPSATTFILHGGVPIALASANHFSFQATPELDIGFGTGTIPNPPPGPNTDLSGFLLRIGARAGGEIHFGFMGIPQLALDASVGLYLATMTGKAATGAASRKVSARSIATTQLSQPWEIFRANLGVRYNF